MITIVDYGMGNIGSVANILKKIGHRATVTGDPEAVAGANRLILPGVGHFAAGMKALEEGGLRAALDEAVLRRGVPVLGICLGMQLMTEHSEEGDAEGLGWVRARAVRFSPERLGDTLPIPHMGWNHVEAVKAGAGVPGFDAETRFYFVHSFHTVCERPEDVLTRTTYGHPFDSSFEVGNVCGVQFHPEKSHSFGMGFLRSYLGEREGA